MKKCFLIAVIVLMSATQTAQASPWGALFKHLKKSFDRVNLTFQVGKNMSDRIQEKADKAEIERLERENEVLRKKIERQEKKDTIHICRQCSIRSVNG